MQRSPDGLRVRQLTRFFQYKYGTELPDDDAGRDDLRIVFDHMVRLKNGRVRMTAFVSLWTPWLSAAEFETLVDDVAAGPPRYYRADQLGERIGLTDAVRTLLRITTIGAVDFNREQRLMRRLRNKAAAEHARRRLKRQAVRDRLVRAVYVLPATKNTKPIAECSRGAQVIHQWLDGKGKQTIPQMAAAAVAADSALAPIALSPHAGKLDRDAVRRKLLRYCAELVDGGHVAWELVTGLQYDTRQVWRLDQAG